MKEKERERKIFIFQYIFPSRCFFFRWYYFERNEREKKLSHKIIIDKYFSISIKLSVQSQAKKKYSN
jgi:hypothetical protein